MQEESRSLFEVLRALADDTGRDHIRVGDLVSAAGDHAVMALVLLFALPNVVPMPPGTSAILGAPLLFFTAQAALGSKPWVPQAIAGRSMPRARFAALLNRAQPWLARAEGLVRPRLQVFARPASARLVGALCVVLALILFLPIPLGNMPPALAISMLAIGLLERDGVWVLAGVATALASIALAGGVALTLAKVAAALLLRALS